jgi:prepilin-type N-terminal cleavage/methylation domain-containing protein
VRQENGFTLIELLAALLASSVLLIALGWVLGSFRREFLRAPVDPEFAQIEAVTPAFVQLVEAMQPPEPRGSAPQLAEDRLIFLTAPPQALGGTGPMAADLRVSVNGAAKAAQLHMSTPGGANAVTAAGTDQIILSGMRDISFVIDAAPPSDTQMLPRLVTLQVTTAKGAAYRIAARPRLNASGSCHFDPISMSCRL